MKHEADHSAVSECAVFHLHIPLQVSMVWCRSIAATMSKLLLQHRAWKWNVLQQMAEIQNYCSIAWNT
jgi:hypothetical protein